MSLFISQPLKETSERKIFAGEFERREGQNRIYFKYNSPLVPSQDCLHLILIHDLGEYHKRYFELGNFLIKELGPQICVSWIDLPGHGFSGGSRAHIDDFDHYCKDLGFYMRSYQRQDQGRARSVLLGQGLGALVALKLYQFFLPLLEKAPVGLVLSNLPLKLRWHLPRGIQKIMEGWQEPFSRLKLPFRLEGRLLNTDKDEGERYDADPLISHGISLGLFNELSQSAELMRTSEITLDLPTLILISGKENLYEKRAMEDFAKKIGQQNGLLKRLSYGNRGHDLFNELRRGIVFKDVCHWIEDSFLSL